MNLKRFNNEVVRLHHSKNEKVIVQQVDDKVYVTDKYCVCILNEPDFIFDKTKLSTADIKSIVENTENNTLLEALKKYTIVENCKTYTILENTENSIEVMINNKYLNYFNDDCTFKIIGPLHPVLVYEHEELVGFILPIKRY